MKKAKSDSKVKKTFVRNCEQKSKNYEVIRDTGSSKSEVDQLARRQELDKPTLCSSEVLANYIIEARNVPQRLSPDSAIDKAELSAKVTKKLNFHFNDRIYNNLVELNADVVDAKTKKERKPKINAIKRDSEPNIEDFCQNEKDNDVIPNIPIVKPKFKPVKTNECGSLHQLVASYEVL